MSPAKRRLALVVSSTFAASAAMFLAPQAASADDGEPFPIVDGHVDWGIKESFRSYVTGPIAGGEISVEDGASELDDGAFQFPNATGEYHLDSHNVEVGIEGLIHFTGHSGALDLTFENLRISTDHGAATGELIVDVVSSGNEHVDTHFADLNLDGLEWERGEYTTLEDVPAILTDAGADAMVANIDGEESRLYEEGEELDPVSISVVAEAPVGDPGNGNGGGNGGEDDKEEGDQGGGNEPEGPLSVSDGRLDWGVKESFRSYVTGPIAGGEITTSGGAEDHGDYYSFPDATGSYDPDSGDVEADFSGEVNFFGHSGALDLTVSDLRLEGDESALQIYTSGIPIANVDVSDAGVDGDQFVVENAAATLTSEGADLFVADIDGEEVRFYEPGDDLDAVYAVLALDESVTIPGGENRLPVTGSTLTWALTGGTALVAAGAVALVLARRQPTEAQ